MDSEFLALTRRTNTKFVPTGLDKAAFKSHLATHNTTYYCSYCPVFRNVRKQKVIAHELKFHRELAEASRASVLDGRGLDLLPLNDQALQAAVDTFFPPLEEPVDMQQYNEIALPAEMAVVPPAVAPTAEITAATAPSYSVPPPSEPYGPGQLPVPPTLREMPANHTFNGAVIAETRREAGQDPNLKRLWEMPSLMVAGITYRKVTESVTLPDGKIYTSVVEEMHRMEDSRREETEEPRRHRRSHKRPR